MRSGSKTLIAISVFRLRSRSISIILMIIFVIRTLLRSILLKLIFFIRIRSRLLLLIIFFVLQTIMFNFFLMIFLHIFIFTIFNKFFKCNKKIKYQSLLYENPRSSCSSSEISCSRFLPNPILPLVYF